MLQWQSMLCITECCASCALSATIPLCPLLNTPTLLCGMQVRRVMQQLAQQAQQQQQQVQACRQQAARGL